MFKGHNNFVKTRCFKWFIRTSSLLWLLKFLEKIMRLKRKIKVTQKRLSNIICMKYTHGVQKSDGKKKKSLTF